jgi:hypothetical protein
VKGEPSVVSRRLGLGMNSNTIQKPDNSKQECQRAATYVLNKNSTVGSL